MAKGMKAETSHRLAVIVHLPAPILQHSSKDCGRTDVVLHDHAAEPWAMPLPQSDSKRRGTSEEK
jgi:hypothetical protein